MSTYTIDSHPAGSGKPLFSALLKNSPADFIVAEQLGFDLDDSGEHLYLHIRKTGTNTDELAKLIEAAYGVTSKDVGFAGMKDRQAVTSQWFSVTTPMGTDTCEQALLKMEGVGKHAELIDSKRHSRKLRRGAHAANAFTIRLHEVQPLTGNTAELVSLVDERIRWITNHGFPNYIGPQRFGFGGQNLVRARQWFQKPKKRTSRQQRSLWLSAGRSALFNTVCEARVADGSWQRLLEGEPAMLSGTRSFFDSAQASPEDLSNRLASMDIHPSAPWWGRGKSLAHAACGEYEKALLEPFADIRIGLERAGLNQERRTLRAVATSLACRWLDDSTLELSFCLPPGVFATTLLSELGQCHEPIRPHDNN